MTVPSGYASPAVDYGVRDTQAKRLLVGTPVPAVNPVVAVIIDRIHTPPFAQADENVMVKALEDCGWNTVMKTERVFVLMKPSPISEVNTGKGRL